MSPRALILRILDLALLLFPVVALFLTGCGADTKSTSKAAARMFAGTLNKVSEISRAPDLKPADGPLASRPPGLTLERPAFNTETYDRIYENDFQAAAQNPLSTFGIDVDTASYSNVRRFLTTERRLPPKDAVRIEELVNYFPYQYSPPTDKTPFATHLEVAGCPWNKEHRLVRIALKGREIDQENRPPCNLVFLVDISGSMSDENKLPLVKQGLTLLVAKLTEKDRVAIVVYASNTGVALPSTPASQRGAILAAIDNLHAGGTTNAGAGIQLAYDEAVRNFIPKGANRVILCTDGDFNVGITNQGDLIRLIQDKAKSGVFLSVFGFGMGNYKDSNLEKLADKGNGQYGYIDSLHEARKVFIEQASGTLFTIAKDVKLQVEFNPARVFAYRLLGYENRLLKAEDFKDDKKDAGDLGAGHTVTAFYEIVPAGKKINLPKVDPLKYQQPLVPTETARGPEMLTVKLRYKQPDGLTSDKQIEVPVVESGKSLEAASEDFRFSAAVVEFGLLLRNSEYKGEATWAQVRQLGTGAHSIDPHGHRAEFLKLVEIAQGLATGEATGQTDSR